MRKIQSKELKIIFIEAFNKVEGFSYEAGNPFIIKIKSSRFFVFLKNISPAYFKNSPDVTRVQLPYSGHFSKVLRANIPFCVLGYDLINDTIVSWNPKKIKERLNAKQNVSLYSRKSLQEKIEDGLFNAGYLTNGEKIIVFSRTDLPLFFEKMGRLFQNNEIKYEDKEEEKEEIQSVVEEDYAMDKLFVIREKALITQLKPLLRKNKVLEAVGICSKHYGSRYKNMKFKDWYRAVNILYQELVS